MSQIETPRPMESAPRNGTMIRLLVQFTDHATEDCEGPAWTIGANSFDDNGEDVWQFAGWCWTHDHFTQGEGTPVGWLPMLSHLVPVEDRAERCEGGQPECGPVEHHDSEGVPLCASCWASLVADSSDAPWVRDNDHTLSCVLLLGADSTGFHGEDWPAHLARIEKWTDDECKAVEDYCLAVHVRASDNHNPIPPKPSVLVG